MIFHNEAASLGRICFSNIRHTLLWGIKQLSAYFVHMRTLCFCSILVSCGWVWVEGLEAVRPEVIFSETFTSTESHLASWDGEKESCNCWTHTNCGYMNIKECAGKRPNYFGWQKVCVKKLRFYLEMIPNLGEGGLLSIPKTFVDVQNIALKTSLQTHKFPTWIRHLRTIPK